MPAFRFCGEGGLAQTPRKNESHEEVFQKEDGKRQFPECCRSGMGSGSGGRVRTESAGYLEGIVLEQMGS